RRIAQESATASVSKTHEFLVKHFEQVVPARTYARTTSPTEEFRRDFASHLEKSKIYLHRGADAGFAAFRVAALAHLPSIRSKLRMNFCVLDPRSDSLLRQRAKLELDNNNRRNRSYSSQDLVDEQKKVQTAIYVALDTLFSVRHLRSVQVFF